MSDTFQTLVISLVLTRLDYGNTVLAGLPVYLVRQLQLVLNGAARLTYHLQRSDHISDALACLHWQRVPVTFKIAAVSMNTCLWSLRFGQICHHYKLQPPGKRKNVYLIRPTKKRHQLQGLCSRIVASI